MVRTRHPYPHIHLSVLNSFVRLILGTLIVVFFQCMVALLNPVTRRGEGIKWGLVSHTAIMFWCATITTGVNQHLISNSFIDNREFPGFGGALPPGPVGYLLIARPAALSIIPNLASLVSYWLADSILVGRVFNPVPTHPGV